ncbi:MAG: T9SS type A sorting domain-containing protein [Saprospiraceae bacterium]|nr:T9SS type A sorting domain-containing protein [Saprospiraceae bacterium]
MINSAFIQNVNCFGQSTGSIGIFTAGGTGSLETTWSNGQTGEDIINLAAGFYTASVTDDNGCFLTETYQITQPDLLNPTINITAPISCNGGSNGVLSVTVAGGTSPFIYLWSNGSTANSASGLAAGTHVITVTDNKGCTSVKQTTLSNPTPIMVATASSSNASCPGIANGSASITIAGGKSPYTVNWSTGETGTTLSNVTSGTYPLTVTDNAGCTAISQVVIGSNQSAVISADTIINPSCFGASNGSIDISATNAIGYTINWSNGDTGSILINLPAGIYTAQALNSQGCLSNALQVTLSQPQALQAVTENIQQITCFGLTNGAIQTEFNGGTGAVQYAWSNGVNAAAVENLAAGPYVLTVSDANGCTTLKSYLIVEPSGIVIDSFEMVNPACFGLATGIISIFPSGGTGTLTTNWAGGFTGNTLNNILAGTFAATISDINGCVESDTFTLTSPTEIIANDSLNNETTPGLANGSIYCQTIGGISPYKYLWSTGDTTSFIDSLAPGLYLLTITDEVGCSRSFQFNVQTGDCALAVNYEVMPVSCFGENDGAVSLDITNGLAPYMVNNPTSALEAGTYNYVITDAAGCTFTIDDVVVTQPALLVVVLDSVVNASGPNIPDGEIDVSVTGGTTSYIYEWRDAADSLVSTVQDARNLLPGLYFFQVIDTNDCIAYRDSIPVSFTSGVKSEDELMSFFMPNPFGSFLKVESKLLPVKVVFYDFNGRIITSSIINEQSDNTINSFDWPSGMYIARLSLSTGESKMVRLVKY